MSLEVRFKFLTSRFIGFSARKNYYFKAVWHIIKPMLKILWGLFNAMLSYELICDESTKIPVFVVVFWQFRWLLSINSKFQCEHNFNQLLGSIPSFWLKITSSNCVEVAQNQALITYGKTKKICVCGNLRLRKSAAVYAGLRRLRRSFVPYLFWI